MNATKKTPISAELLAELKNVLMNPYAPPDGHAMANAIKQINRMRRETRTEMGELDVALDLIRDARA